MPVSERYTGLRAVMIRHPTPTAQLWAGSCRLKRTRARLQNRGWTRSIFGHLARPDADYFHLRRDLSGPLDCLLTALGKFVHSLAAASVPLRQLYSLCFSAHLDTGRRTRSEGSGPKESSSSFILRFRTKDCPSSRVLAVSLRARQLVHLVQVPVVFY